MNRHAPLHRRLLLPLVVACMYLPGCGATRVPPQPQANALDAETPAELSPDDQASIAGEPAADSDVPPSADLVESETLKAELSKLVRESLQAARDAGEPAPKGLDPEDLAGSIIRQTRKYHPTFLWVGPEVERLWKEGKIADAAARARMKAAIKTLADFGVALPRMHQQVIEEYRAETLRGARLELAAQLLEAEVAKFLQGLSPGSNSN